VDKLHKYFWDGTQVGHPRAFPICVTTENGEIKARGTGDFANLIKSIYKDFREKDGQRFYKFNEATDLMTTSNADRWVDKVGNNQL